MLAKYSGANGTHIWSKGFGSSAADFGYGVAVDSNANVVLTGGFAGAVNLGGGSLANAGGRDMFLAKFSGGGPGRSANLVLEHRDSLRLAD